MTESPKSWGKGVSFQALLKEELDRRNGEIEIVATPCGRVSITFWSGSSILCRGEGNIGWWVVPPGDPCAHQQ